MKQVFNTRSIYGEDRLLELPHLRGAAAVLPETDFARGLEGKFGTRSALKIIHTLKKSGLPVPENTTEYLSSTQGILLLVNRYGLVVRVENADSHNVYEESWRADRLGDTGVILQPLASVDCDAAIVQFFPGVHVHKEGWFKFTFFDGNILTPVTWRLERESRRNGVEYWDSDTENTGHLPAPDGSRGIPVIIDYLAVRRLNEGTQAIRTAFEREAAARQVELYSPLRDAFHKAWGGAAKTQAFLELCRQYLQEGRLVAGWLSTSPKYGTKTFFGQQAAAVYERRFTV